MTLEATAEALVAEAGSPDDFDVIEGLVGTDPIRVTDIHSYLQARAAGFRAAAQLVARYTAERHLFKDGPLRIGDEVVFPTYKAGSWQAVDDDVFWQALDDVLPDGRDGMLRVLRQLFPSRGVRITALRGAATEAGFDPELVESFMHKPEARNPVIARVPVERYGKGAGDVADGQPVHTRKETS